MRKAGNLRYAIMASAAVLALAGCSDTDIASPGAETIVDPAPAPDPDPAPAPSTINLVPASGCPTGTTETTFAAVAADGFSDVDVCSIGSDSGETNINSDLTIPANSTIAIQGPVFVGTDGGANAVLTIGEGVRFFGASSGGSANATDDYLVITRGSAIEASGTEAAPIRFTSRAAINDEEVGTSIISETSNAQWGGLVINGFAPINACDGAATGGTAECEKTGEGASGLFGGDDPLDDSGSLNYVIVEYAGARLTNNDELNGIAFQGVGSGTEVNYIQVHNNLDDGIEWFGGTVNVNYAVVTGAGDDSIDWTDGWTGTLQFAAVRSNIPTSGDPRGIEGDNLSSNNAAEPFSEPTIANFTLVGVDENNAGAVIRRGTKGNFVNGVLAGFPVGLDVDSTQTFTNFTNGELTFSSIAIDAPTPFATDSDGVPAFDPADNVTAYNNSLIDVVFPGTAEANFPAAATPTGLMPADYVGAFSATESNGASWANFALPGTLVPTDPAECPTGTMDAGTIVEAATSTEKLLCQIDGSNAITSNLRLSNGDQIVYELVEPVFIGVDAGPDPAAPLAGSAQTSITIDAGVTVVSEGNDDYLVITRGSQIFSNGTASDPVVFTAKGAFDGSDATVNANTKGLWGGIVVNGRAPINACDGGAAVGGTVDCEKSGEGASGLFGGATADDDSGQIFFTRIQYAGVRLTNNDELNGLALQGVGSGTELQNIQVYNNLDDAFEWFGGTVSATNLIALGVGDDSFDWTDGWQGSLQYGIAYPGLTDATGALSGDPRGIEGDNLSSNNTATPVSTPRVSNITLINSGDAATDTGAVLRRGMAGTVVNTIAVGWPDAGLDIDSQATVDNLGDGSLVVESFFLSGNGDDVESPTDEAGDGVTVPAFPATANIVTGEPITLGGFTFQTGRNGVVPGTNELAVPVFDVTGIGELEPTTYIGAVADADDDWFLGWTVDQTGAETSN
ncbi:MAG: hypothetical protein QNI84_06690 [Henriciella sp.]|nr:hypothetical protein [Henriciella sp.]